MNILGMFARRPEPGKTKTRLAASIGGAAATDLYAAFVQDLISRCPMLAEEFIVAATPGDQLTRDWFQPRLPENGRLELQPEGDLGKRIAWFFEAAACSRQHKVVLIGSDSPDLPESIIISAFASLSTHDVVISPAEDGGYVLIGLSVAPGNLFRNIRWSTESTLSDTLSACEQNHHSLQLLAPWYDVDTISDLKFFAQRQPEMAPHSNCCPLTMSVLGQLDAVGIDLGATSLIRHRNSES